MNVAILGCGPSGLLAAHACEQAGVRFKIFSKKRKSELFGSQYLHKHIDGVTHDTHYVDVVYEVRGTPEEYRRKVHGKHWDGHIAPEEFEPNHRAWNIRQAYDTLWTMYRTDIVDYEIRTFENNEYFAAYNNLMGDLRLDRYDLVISTVPRTIWKVEGEEFIYSQGWAMGDAPEKGIFVEMTVPENTIICDGTYLTSWTRASNVFGYTSLEWPHHAPRPHPMASVVTKPLHYTAASQNPNPTADWLHVGRYGQWEKGIVVTDAYDDVVKKLQEIM